MVMINAWADAWTVRWPHFYRKRPSELRLPDLAAIEKIAAETGIRPGAVFECWLRGCTDVLTPEQERRFIAWYERYRRDGQARAIYEAICEAPAVNASGPEKLAYLFMYGLRQPAPRRDNDTPATEAEQNTGGQDADD
jgi:hypothetical protein